MLRKLLVPALAASLVLSACDQSPTEPAAEAAEDYALVMFGEAGAALEGTMGTAPTTGAFDGATAFHQLPDRIALSPAQIAAIRALREAFRTEHQTELSALRAIFQEARAAHEGGATREEVHAILMQGRAIALALRPAVIELHLAIWDLLTDAQRIWLRLHHRMHDMPRPIAEG